MVLANNLNYQKFCSFQEKIVKYTFSVAIEEVLLGIKVL